MMLKKGEFQQNKKNTKEEFVRSAKINGRDQNIVIDVILNHNKGLYNVQPKISAGMITGNKAEDKALLKVISDLTENAIEYCKEWREDWMVKNKMEDERQLKI